MATDESTVQPPPQPVAESSKPPRRPPRREKQKPPKREGRDVPPTKAAKQASSEPAKSSPADDGSRFSIAGFFRSMGAMFVSAIFHLVMLIVLAVMVLPSMNRPTTHELLVVDTPVEEDELENFDFMDEVEAAEAAASFTTVGTSSAVGAVGQAAGLDVALDQKVVQKAEAMPNVQVPGLMAEAPSVSKLIQEAPEGMLGESRAIVDNLSQAMDRIAKEIIWQLDKSNVLVIWAFDQSSSMKPDQIEIRDRIDHVYRQLGLHRPSSGDRLTTAITSYGEGFFVHTSRPTSKVDEIRAAIDMVPNDPSGKEMMCSAVAASIGVHRDYAGKQKRQVMLILVTDETGEREDNLQNLEATIALAKEAKARVYVLGREAVFGYPYAHMKWRHPQTGHIHWLPVDRGPETAFVEQLQTECFRKRTDAHPSGFGPYSQSRMARETGGIYFMLPSLESDIVRGEKRRYELEAMRSYQPDLRHRRQLIAERDASILRSTLWKIIHDLNPYDKKIAAAMQVAFSFSSNEPQFLAQVRKEQAKARDYIVYLDAAAKALESIRRYREQEPSPRWQANYDLIYAQVLAYTARTYEYGAYLEHFINNPKIVPREKPKFLRLSSWHIRESKKHVGAELTETYIARSSSMFNQVIEEHAGTPWAARAVRSS